MTAETLKPFITPQQRVENFPATQTHKKQSKCNAKVLAISFGLTSMVFAAIFLSITCWSMLRISQLETDVVNLNHVIDSMQRHLGINYLDDLNEAEEFEKEYANALIDDPDDTDRDAEEVDVDSDDDDDDDEDDDDEEPFSEYYDDLIKKFSSYDDEDDDAEDSNMSDDDNLYDDFEKFKDSKKKKQNTRKERSIAEVSNELAYSGEMHPNEFAKPTNSNEKQQQNIEAQQQEQHNTRKPTMRATHPIYTDGLGTKVTHAHRRIVNDNVDRRRTPLRPRAHTRRQRIPTIKSESLLSAKSVGELSVHHHTPAAHFHLHRKVPERYAAMRVDAYSGDMYIGHASAPNDLAIERYFMHNNGILIVREPGLYYVYAQVCYNNTHDQNGFVIFHGHKPFLQCLNTVPTNTMKIHTCHTSGLIHLEANETIHLRDFHTDRSAILKDGNNRSYFGIIKI